MSYPKLTMRDLRKHPAVITNPAELEIEMTIATGFLLPTIGKATRCAEAIVGMTNHNREGKTIRYSLVEGYKHTPTWGLVIDDVATIDWVDDNSSRNNTSYASLQITKTSRNLPLSEKIQHLAHSMDGIMDSINMLPQVEEYGLDDHVVHTIEAVVSFEELGVIPSQYNPDRFVIDLSRL